MKNELNELTRVEVSTDEREVVGGDEVQFEKNVGANSDTEF